MNNEEKQESVWSKAIPFKEQVAIFKRLMGFVKHFKFEMTIALIGAFLVSIINILLPRGLQYFLDNFLLKQSATTQIILFAGLLYAIGSILKAVIQFTYQYFFALGSEKNLESIRRALYRKLHKLGMRYFDQTPAGSIVSRVTNDDFEQLLNCAFNSSNWCIFCSYGIGGNVYYQRDCRLDRFSLCANFALCDLALFAKEFTALS